MVSCLRRKDWERLERADRDELDEEQTEDDRFVLTDSLSAYYYVVHSIALIRYLSNTKSS